MHRAVAAVAALLAAGPASSQTATRFVAGLDGGQVSPPTASTATGVAVLTLYEPSNLVLGTAKVSGFATATAMTADVHVGAPGANTPARFSLGTFTATAPPFCGTTRLTASEVAALKSGGLYVDVRTTAYPGGEIRGQLDTGQGSVFAAVLDGAQNVPPVATKGWGHATVTVNPDATLDYLVATAGVAGFGAHIHDAPPGVNGGVVIGLSGASPLWQGTTRPLVPLELAGLRGGRYYVNVHSPGFPAGEIRGQLLRAGLPTIFGTGCAGSNGEVPLAAAPLPPLLGAATDFLVMPGAAPGLAGIWFVDLAPLSPPVDLAVAGAPGCLLYVSPVPAWLPITADANGCARVRLTTPFDRSLEGARLYAQALLLDPGAAGGLVTSNGVAMTVQ